MAIAIKYVLGFKEHLSCVRLNPCKSAVASHISIGGHENSLCYSFTFNWLAFTFFVLNSPFSAKFGIIWKSDLFTSRNSCQSQTWTLKSSILVACIHTQMNYKETSLKNNWLLYNKYIFLLRKFNIFEKTPKRHRVNLRNKVQLNHAVV